MITMSNYTTTVTSVKRADGVEFIMHRTKYSWGTYSNITYLLLNDEDITQLATFNPPLYQKLKNKISKISLFEQTPVYLKDISTKEFLMSCAS